jgi:hypothetical protein
VSNAANRSARQRSGTNEHAHGVRNLFCNGADGGARARRVKPASSALVLARHAQRANAGTTKGEVTSGLGKASPPVPRAGPIAWTEPSSPRRRRLVHCRDRDRVGAVDRVADLGAKRSRRGRDRLRRNPAAPGGSRASAFTIWVLSGRTTPMATKRSSQRPELVAAACTRTHKRAAGPAPDEGGSGRAVSGPLPLGRSAPPRFCVAPIRGPSSAELVAAFVRHQQSKGRASGGCFSGEAAPCRCVWF